MKKILRTLPILLALLLFASCDILRPRTLPAEGVNTFPENDPAVSLPANGEPQGIRNNIIEFEAMEMDVLPDTVRTWADETSQSTERVAEHMDDGDYTYILVGLGEQPSAGYAAEVSSIKDPEEGKYTVTIKTTDPEEDSENAAVITYPAAVVRIAKTNIELAFVNEDGTNFFK